MNIHFNEYTEEYIDRLPALTLAHIGDAVYELLARVYALGGTSVRVGDVDHYKQRLVQAESQARAARAVFPCLTEKEQGIFRRARNAKPGNVPHHSSPGEYGLATALESLLGYLYLTEDEQRLACVWSMITAALEEEE